MSFSNNRWLRLLSYPWLAMTSPRFYVRILMEMRGVGFYYLLAISAAAALPGVMQVMHTLDGFRQLELDSLAAQLPPSYVDANGYLHPSGDNPEYKELKNSKGQTIAVYNLGDQPLQAQDQQAVFELKREALIINGSQGRSSILWSSIFPAQTSIDPYTASETISRVINSSFITVWPLVTLWLLGIMAFNVVIAALISRFMYLILFKIKLQFAMLLRLSAFANTVGALLLILQFYIYIPMLYSVLAVLPVLYLYTAGKSLRCSINDLMQKKKQGNTAAQASASSDQGGDGTFTP